MPAGRFLLVETPLAEDTEIELPPEVAHQARDVLRLGVGGMLRLLDGAGGEYPAQVIEVSRKRVLARLGAREEGLPDPPVRVTLCLGMLKAAKFEVALQKCTELGVAAFFPLLTERAVRDEVSEAKRRRWRGILAEALEQCGGSHLPELSPPQSLSQTLADLPPGGIALFPWEETREPSLRAALEEAVAQVDGVEHVREVRLFIGPEGGFSPAEAELAERSGARLVTLGRRILRAETAAIVASALTFEILGALE
ncbi:MAG TPA: RsmE family RNA methyltransferase [Ktedonobacterales bacterium]|jgi:16S rRNA (uracil1498-N3)-methyltransferase|nr:RsmE family RNA methyltransferase [Ktedonobacterales bacterium]